MVPVKVEIMPAVALSTEAKKLVVVAFVPVALRKVKFCKVVEPVARILEEVKRLVIVVVLNIDPVVPPATNEMDPSVELIPLFVRNIDPVPTCTVPFTRRLEAKVEVALVPVPLTSMKPAKVEVAVPAMVKLP